MVTWASDLSRNKFRGGAASRWCVGFAISFAVVLGFADLRSISLSPNVARYGTDSSLSWWRFVGLWWSVVGFCWFVVGLAVGQDVVAGSCVAVNGG